MVKREVQKERTASMEDYLEAITILAKEGYPVKVTEIGKALGVKKPSVTAALAKLSTAGLVQHEKYGDVTLTAEGAKIGEDVHRRHRTLRRFLVEILNVEPSVAEADACRIEHVVSQMTMERLIKLLDFVLNCPLGEAEWLKGLNYYFEHGKRDEKLLAKCQKRRVKDNVAALAGQRRFDSPHNYGLPFTKREGGGKP